MARPWEDCSEHPWEASSDSDGDRHWDSDASSDDESPWDKMDRSQCGDQLAEELLSLQNRGALSARAVCVLAFWATKAGAQGFVEKLGHRPAAASGHYQRHLDSVLQRSEAKKELYEVAMPGHSRYDRDRVSHTVRVMPCHEQLANELVEQPELGPRLDELIERREWGEDYYSHPVVLANPEERVYPISLYLDAVAHSKVDAVLGITISNMVSGTRHLCVVVRRTLMCRCGCRGWCSMRAIWAFVQWCLQALVVGLFPTERHDRAAWGPADDCRESLQGLALGMKGAILQVKADWGEFAKTLALSSWSHALRPCPFCDTSKEKLFSIIREWSLLDNPANLTTPESYEAACRSCELVRYLSREDHAAVLARLVYSKRGTGGHGRCLATALPALGLERFDRLEPSDELFDVSLFETVDVFPFRAVFWRRHPQDFVQHRLPIFVVAGCNIDRLCIDHLHTMNLGVYQRWCLHSLWALVDADCWNVGAHFSADEQRQLSCEYIRSELTQYYSELRRSIPGLGITVIPHFSLSTIGGQKRSLLRTKGAETKFLLGFVVQCMERRGGRLEFQNQLVEAGRCLVAYDASVSSMPRRISATDTHQLLQCMKRFCAIAEVAGISPTPKFHLWLHMILRTRFQGSPMYGATWKDEALNKTIRDIAKNAGSVHFDARLLLRFKCDRCGVLDRKSVV